jgi:diaminohydroxyphosphoribosylaminopyrimidine deaminase/5-amino-6-(5-phosphoribosylamino)uracil reductase
MAGLINHSDFELKLMHQAMALAERGRGWVEPNPMVGALVVRDGKIVAEGWHQRFGGPHAEIHALEQAGAAAQGATIYITLEPCCHQGKTPPCTDAIIQAGIKKVVAAMRDPFPQVDGGGFAQLQRAGIEVVAGVGEAEAAVLNAPYLKLLRTGKPWVIAKWAMTLDGHTATASGDSKWISNEQSRAKVHELRGRMDAIIVGIGTVLADDPLLTARPPGPRAAARVIVDPKLRVPVNSQLVQTAREVPVLIFHQQSADSSARQNLEQKGCECLPVNAEPQEVVQSVLTELGNRRFTNVLVEGGSRLLGSFFDAQEVDEVWAFIAPRIIGSAGARTPVSGVGAEWLKKASALTDVHLERFGDDVLMRGLLRSSFSPT